MNRSKAVGTDAETALADYLAHWWPTAERRALHGSLDKGDIAGTPLTWECKSVIRGGYDIPGWLRELEAEIANTGDRSGLLVVKPRGVGIARVGDWWAIQPLRLAVRDQFALELAVRAA